MEVVGEILGDADIVGLRVGDTDIVGFELGAAETVGCAVGEAVGRFSQAPSRHGIQTSPSSRIIAPPGAEDLKPDIHWQRGRNLFPSVPTMNAWASRHS